MPGSVSGGTWNSGGTILFSANRQGTGIFRVPAAGGTPTEITALDRGRGDTWHRYPKFLPDGRRFLYLRVSGDVGGRQGIMVGSIDSAGESQPTDPTLRTNRQAFYAPPAASGPGRLLFLRDTTLFAQTFDAGTVELSGDPVPVTDQVGSFGGANAGLFSISETGVLAYRIGLGGNQVQLTWFDTKGSVIGTIGDKSAYTNPTLSPDDSRVAVTQFDQSIGNSNVWVLDVMRGTSTKITFSVGRNDFPVWSPDGKSIAYASNRDGYLDMYQRNADGSGEETLLLKSQVDKQPRAWTSDGRFILFSAISPTKGGSDIWVLPLQGERKPVELIATDSNENNPSVSPDMRWLAYTSDETGTPEVFVVPFTPDKSATSMAGKWLISKSGGINPIWRGKRLFYNTLSLQQMAVDYTADTTFSAGIPQMLFRFPYLNRFGASADGTRFLYITPEQSSITSPFIVVSNWQSGLK